MHPQLRALLVAFHLYAVLMLSMPRPAVSDKDVQDDAVMAWFDRVHDQLTAAGISLDKQQMIDTLVHWGRWYGDVRSWLVYPANRYATYTGAKQSWRMFGDVPQKSARLVVEIRQGDEQPWQPVYVPRSHEHDWRRRMFEHERPRTLTNQWVHKKARSRYRYFTRWLARELAADFPEATAFRVSMEVVVFPPPEVLAKTHEVVPKNRYWTEVLQADAVEGP